MRLLHIINTFALAIWLGSGLYFTLAANQLFSALPEDTAGQAVGALFPTFFAISTLTSIITVVTYVLLGRHEHVRGFRFGFTFGLIGFLGSAVNEFFFLPHIEQIEKQMGPISKASQSVLQQFGMWHGISMLIEFLVLVAAACLLCTTALFSVWQAK